MWNKGCFSLCSFLVLVPHPIGTELCLSSAWLYSPAAALEGERAPCWKGNGFDSLARASQKRRKIPFGWKTWTWMTCRDWRSKVAHECNFRFRVIRVRNLFGCEQLLRDKRERILLQDRSLLCCRVDIGATCHMGAPAGGPVTPTFIPTTLDLSDPYLVPGTAAPQIAPLHGTPIRTIYYLFSLIDYQEIRQQVQTIRNATYSSTSTSIINHSNPKRLLNRLMMSEYNRTVTLHTSSSICCTKYCIVLRSTWYFVLRFLFLYGFSLLIVFF